MKKYPSLLLAAVAGTCITLAGCTNDEGRFRPPDPLGRALFDFFDRPRTDDRRYTGVPDVQYQDRNRSPGPGYVWVDGTYGHDASGRRYWIPAHWTRL